MAFRVVSAVMAAVFAFAVALQYNDPDPLAWMVVYGAVCGVSAVAALRRHAPYGIPLGIGLVALVWGATIALRAPGLDVYSYMFDAWEMKSVPIEEAREATGLAITGAWTFLLAWRSGGSGRAHSTNSENQRPLRRASVASSPRETH